MLRRSCRYLILLINLRNDKLMYFPDESEFKTGVTQEFCNFATGI